MYQNLEGKFSLLLHHKGNDLPTGRLAAFPVGRHQSNEGGNDSIVAVRSAQTYAVWHLLCLSLIYIRTKSGT